MPTEGSTETSATQTVKKRASQVPRWVLTGLAFYLCWLLLRPFLPAVTWALALAVTGFPIHRQLERRLPANVAAFTSVLTIGLILLIPGFFLVAEILHEANDSLQAFRRSVDTLEPSQLAAQYPLAEALMNWLQTRFDFDQELRRAAGALAAQFPAALSSSVQFVIQVSLMLVVLFYFLRDHRGMILYMGGLLPLSSEDATKVFRRLSLTIRATLYGNLTVKFVQGLLGGLMFWILALPAPALFGAAMAICAMLPIVGTALVWGPAAIFLMSKGAWVKALILIIWGAFVVSIIDNFLYPLLVAIRIEIHTLGILLAVLGGLVAFGIAGVVLGPVILAGTVALLEVWRPPAEAESAN